MPMMLMIFVVMVTVFAIGTELKHATAREWLGTAKRFGRRRRSRGKVLPVTVGDVPDVAGDAGDHLQGRGNVPLQRQS